MKNGDGIIILRALRLKNIGRRDPERKLLSGILMDEDMSAVVGRALEDKYATVLQTFVGAEPAAADDGSFMEFLKWLLANQDAVIAFIKVVMDLFKEMEETQ